MNAIPAAANQFDSSPEDVTRRIMSLLSQRGGPFFCNITVRFKSGTATVSGRVRSFYERQLGIVCCQHVPGVHRVVDLLQVDYPSSEVISSEKRVGI